VISPPFLYGTAWKEDRTASLVELAIQNGFRAIDTANQRKHYFEAAVGEGLASAYRAGLVTREALFLQTKFTYMPGQDHRLPYDPSAPLGEQVAQSMASSLEHLGTDYVDSFVLHGPASAHGWTEYDQEVWLAMVREHLGGRTLTLGVSNVSIRHLEQMPKVDGQPLFVQNRCFARLGWDREVRTFCRERGMIYQAFSLLTANPEVMRHPYLHRLAEKYGATWPQIVFAFARGVGMLPMTGTSSQEHMRQDLDCLQIALTDEELDRMETLVA
jgi:diketogulonate reductase-like aldo/keto reductase